MCVEGWKCHGGIAWWAMETASPLGIQLAVDRPQWLSHAYHSVQRCHIYVLQSCKRASALAWHSSLVLQTLSFSFRNVSTCRGGSWLPAAAKAVLSLLQTLSFMETCDAVESVANSRLREAVLHAKRCQGPPVKPPCNVTDQRLLTSAQSSGIY